MKKVERTCSLVYILSSASVSQDLDYADDIALLPDSVEAGQTFQDKVPAAAAKLGLALWISRPKTKVTSFGYDIPVITFDGTPLDVVPTFVYLESSISACP